MVTSEGTPRPFHEVVHDDRNLVILRSAFKKLNRSMVSLWRLGLGRWSESWPWAMGRILVVEHHGRKSGMRYLTPLNFSRDAQVVWCVAAFGSKTDWYRNAAGAGEVTIFLPDGAWRVRVLDASDAPDRIDRIRSVLRDAGFASYLAGINPRRMTDEELSEVTREYRLIRFDPIAPSIDEIDDLRWVLPSVVLSAIGLFALARRMRSS